MQIKLKLQYHDKVITETDDGYFPNNYTEKQRNEIAEKWKDEVVRNMVVSHEIIKGEEEIPPLN